MPAQAPKAPQTAPVAVQQPKAPVQQPVGVKQPIDPMPAQQPTQQPAVAPKQPQPKQSETNVVQSKSILTQTPVAVEKPNQTQEQMATQNNAEEPLQNKKSKKKSKKFYFIASSILLSLVIIGVFVMLILNSVKDNEQLFLPSSAVVEVVEMNNQYYLQVPEHNVAMYYIFEIAQDDQEPFLLFSNKNIIDVSAYFNQDSVFELRYFVQKASEKSRSLPSLAFTYVHQQQLLAPILSYDEQTHMLSWNYVSGAASYEFFYAAGNEVLSFKVEQQNQPQDEGHGSHVLPLPYGNYQICVVAHPQNTIFYLSSPASNTINVQYYGQRQSVNSASYSLSGQTVTIDASNLQQEHHVFELTIGTQKRQFIPQIKQNTYVLNLAELNITLTIGMTVSVVTQGDGAYIMNSNAVIASSNT